MCVIQSIKDIEKISLEILKDSKSLDIFPTPIDKIVSYVDLTVSSNVDISQIHEGYKSKYPDALLRALGKIRGLLVRKEKKVYLDLNQLDSRKNFVKLHEVGHDVLPWQQKCFDVLDDDDESLKFDTHEEFEAEANFFASVTLFQHDRFTSAINKYPLDIDTPIQLSTLFGASIHATLRRYVEYSSNRCALLVLEKPSRCGALLRNKFQSPSFTSTFGEMGIPNVLDYFAWPFVQDYIRRQNHIKNGTFSLFTSNGLTQFTYHFFNNSYNAFVLVFPNGERNIVKSCYFLN